MLIHNDTPLVPPEEVRRVNRILFLDSPITANNIDICLVLGSANCSYRINRAIDFSAGNNNMLFVVSGGGQYSPDGVTEAAFMRHRLIDSGISPDRIFEECRSKFTRENVVFSLQIIDGIYQRLNKKKLDIALITAGFHMARVLKVINELNVADTYTFHPVPAFSQKMKVDNWFRYQDSVDIIYAELQKLSDNS